MTDAPCPVPAPERKWRVRQRRPLPQGRGFFDGLPTGYPKEIFAPFLTLEGVFGSWTVGIETLEAAQASLDALFAAYPSATRVWVGNVVVESIDPAPPPTIPVP